MKRLRNRALTALTVIGLLAMSGVALAASDDDTVFNYGYDQDSQFFMWNVTSLDYSPNTDALEDEGSTADTEFEALLAACGLGAEVGDEPAEYGYTFDGTTIQVYELTDGEFDPDSDDPIESESADCGEFDGGYVTGPEGQVNHGMFLKLFNEMYEGENRGCLVRHIARSDLGKDDQQVEADPEFEADETVEPIGDGTITFTTTGADCVRGPERGEGDEEIDEESERRGPPQFVKDKFGGDGPGNGKGKPEGTPGGRP